MKTTFILIGAVLLLPPAAFAGAEGIIKQRAKELSNQNNVRQGVASPAQPATPSATPVRATVSPALARLQADLAVFKTGTPATAAEKKKLEDDILALAETAKPARATVAKLVEDMTAAFADRALPSSSRTRLAQEFDAVLNPSKYPQAKVDGIVADAQAIFQENGLARNKAVAIADGLKAVAADIQRGGAR
jgi:hypothetical protein